MITKCTFLSGKENMHKHFYFLFSRTLLVFLFKDVACCQPIAFKVVLRPEVISSVSTTQTVFSPLAWWSFSSPLATAVQHEVTFKWPQLAIQAALHLATEAEGSFLSLRWLNHKMRIRRGQGRGKINACWKDAEEVRNLLCLFSASSLSFAAMTSLSVIKGTLHGDKCLSITGVLIVSGARPVLQPHFPMFKRKISIGEVRLGGTWLPNMQGTLRKRHSFQCNVDLPAALFLLLVACNYCHHYHL